MTLVSEDTIIVMASKDTDDHDYYYGQNIFDHPHPFPEIINDKCNHHRLLLLLIWMIVVRAGFVD